MSNHDLPRTRSHDVWLAAAVKSMLKLRKAGLKVLGMSYDTRSVILRVRGLAIATAEVRFPLPVTGSALVLEDFKRGEFFVAALNKAWVKGVPNATGGVRRAGGKGNRGAASSYRVAGLLRGQGRVREDEVPEAEAGD